jgi:hypothetical protein
MEEFQQQLSQEEYEIIDKLLLYTYGGAIASPYKEVREMGAAKIKKRPKGLEMARQYCESILANFFEADPVRYGFVSISVWVSLILRLFAKKRKIYIGNGNEKSSEKKLNGEGSEEMPWKKTGTAFSEKFEVWFDSTFKCGSESPYRKYTVSSALFIVMAIESDGHKYEAFDAFCKQIALSDQNRAKLEDQLFYRDDNVDDEVETLYPFSCNIKNGIYCRQAGQLLSNLAAPGVLAQHLINGIDTYPPDKWFEKALENTLIRGVKKAARSIISFSPPSFEQLQINPQKVGIWDYVRARMLEVGLPPTSRHEKQCVVESEIYSTVAPVGIEEPDPSERNMFSKADIAKSIAPLYVMIAQQIGITVIYMEDEIVRMIILCSQLPQATALVKTLAPGLNVDAIQRCHLMRDGEWMQFLALTIRADMSLDDVENVCPQSKNFMHIVEPGAAIIPSECIRRYLVALRNMDSYITHYKVIDSGNKRITNAREFLRRNPLTTVYGALRTFQIRCIASSPSTSASSSE